MDQDKILETVRERKALWGNYFEEYAQKLTVYGLAINKPFHIAVTAQDAVMTLALMKLARIQAIEAQLVDLRSRRNKVLNGNIVDKDLEEEITCKELALIDSELDYACYLWIARHYDEYKEMI